MKKIVLAAIAAFSFATANAQSNEKGTIHLNVMGGFIVGSNTDKMSSENFNSTLVGGEYGINANYGLSEDFSAGLGLAIGSNTFTPSSSDSGFGLTTSASTFKIGLNGRYYIVNKDRFNFFAGPEFNYVSAKDATSLYGDLYKYTGFDFGVNTGINFYFTDVVGGIVQLGYDKTMTKSNTIEGFSYDRNYGGVKILAGLSIKL